MNKNISIIWDFDGTLTPIDSTSKTVEILKGQGSDKVFWDTIKQLRGDTKKPVWEHVLASDAPIWMFSLSRLAAERNIPLNSEFFKKFVVRHVNLFPHVESFLKEIKSLEKTKRFEKQNLKINHFVVSAGLKELVEQCFPKDLIHWTFGCRYTVAYDDAKKKGSPVNVPVFCMDETMKTRSVFEIVKGTFDDPSKPVNTRVEDNKLWSPFSNLIYIGDGPTDVPAMSLIRDRGGIAVAVYDKAQSCDKTKKRLHQMSLDRRVDFITPAEFSSSGELSKYIKARCSYILKQHEASDIDTVVQ